MAALEIHLKSRWKCPNFKLSSSNEQEHSYWYRVGIWNLETFEIRNLWKYNFQMVLVLAMAIAQTIQKLDHSKAATFLSRFQMVFDKMAPICLDFKWMGFRISDPICDPTSFGPFKIQTRSDFRSPLYIKRNAWELRTMVLLVSLQADTSLNDSTTRIWKLHRGDLKSGCVWISNSQKEVHTKSEIQKPDHLKYGQMDAVETIFWNLNKNVLISNCPVFKMVRNIAFGIARPFRHIIICQLDRFGPVEYCMCLVFKPSLNWIM